MPDANKFAKLREIGYQIQVCCGLCLHGQVVTGCQWGTCAKHPYDHLKHTGPERGVSVHVFGTCPFAEMDPVKEKAFGAHREFLVGRM